MVPHQSHVPAETSGLGAALSGTLESLQVIQGQLGQKFALQAFLSVTGIADTGLR